MTTSQSMKSWRMLFIMVWNVAGELHRPKNMTMGSNSPRLVENAAFHSSPKEKQRGRKGRGNRRSGGRSGGSGAAWRGAEGSGRVCPDSDWMWECGNNASLTIPRRYLQQI